MISSLYQPVFLTAVSILTIVMAGRYLASQGSVLSDKNQSANIFICVPLCILLTLWLGFRPPFAGVFGDTVNYAHGYVSMNLHRAELSFQSEWLFNWISYFCKANDLDVSIYFTIIEFIYVFTALWAIYRFVPKNPLLGMIFVWGTLSYYTFSVNGLRNGMACHILLLATSYFFDSKYVPAAILAIAGFSIHRSVLLPIAAILASRYFIRDSRLAVYIWLGSIVVSLIVGNYFVGFFTSLNFDDRMAGYSAGGSESAFSRSGFRWDFLIYSAMPVLMGYIVLIKKHMRENWYRVLFNSYCLANAFWILIIRIEFSNRFAYLSWFLYPVVIAYPLIMMRVWPDQDKKTACILLAYVGFTVLMNTLYW